MKSRIALLTWIVLASCAVNRSVSFAAPMGTAFTYQGRFNASGNPANGAYDFEFRLFDAATAGNQVGSTVTKADLAVSDGYFTTTLDFGSGRFTGDARWLQIAVRPGAETGSYTTLTPRHELTPTPYAINSDNEGTANYIPKFTSAGMVNSVLYESGGNIGIGTTNPQTRLHLDGSFIADTAGTTGSIASGGSQPFWITRAGGTTEGLSLIVNDHGALIQNVQDENSAGYGSMLLRLGNLANQTPDFQISDYRNATDAVRLHLDIDNGNVGIGTTTPAAKLDVYGAAAGVAPNILTNGDVVIGIGAGLFFDHNHWYAGGNYILPAGGTNTQGFFTSGAERMRITSDGNIGMGTTAPVQKLDVSGTVRCVSVVQTSDEQLKTGIQPLTGVLNRLSQVRAVSFEWNERAQSLGAKAGAKQIGVLAQELEQVFPELVTTPELVSVDELAKGYSEKMLTPEVKERLERDAEATHYKAVNYSQLTVVLLGAVKELQAQNASLEERIKTLESRAR